MIVKIRIPWFASSTARLAPVAPSMESVRAGSTFHAALTGFSEDWVMQGAPETVFIPRPEVSETQRPGPGMLARAWSLVRTKYALTATKRLRVAETVSLGEKRFVSIVCVGSREFLIGGGTTSVSLLAQLSPAGEFSDTRPSDTRGDGQ